MTPSELKHHVANGSDSLFFSRDSMKFAGDTMRNYGVRAATINTIHGTAEVWELYRKHPVKHGLHASAYFDRVTFSRVYPAN